MPNNPRPQRRPRTADETVALFLAELHGCPVEVIPAVQQSKIARLLPTRLRNYRSRPGNRDGRGVKHAVNEQIAKTFTQLRYALRHIQTHADGNIRREARTLVRSLQSDAFEEVSRRASRYIGAVNRAGHQRKERARLNNRAITLVDDLLVTQLNSSDQLSAVGRQFRNCVASKRGWGHEYLRSGETEFYLIERTGEPIALMEVHAESREISQIAGPENDDVRLTRRQALGICRALDVSGDDEPTFTQVGAYRMFRDGDPFHTGWLAAGERKCKLYTVTTTHGSRAQRELVVRWHPATTLDEDTSTWSRFTRTVARGPSVTGFGGTNPEPLRAPPRRRPRRRRRGYQGEWSAMDCHEQAMSEGELLELTLRAPAVYAALRKIALGVTPPPRPRCLR